MDKAEKIPKGYRVTEAGILPVDWQVKRLSEVATELTERAGQDKYETVSISAGVGFVNQAEKFGKELSGKQYEKYIVLHKGDFSYNKGNSKIFPQGCIYRLNDREVAAVPNVFESFRIKEQDANYYEQLFLSGFLNKQLYSRINHGVRDDGLLNLTGKDFYSCMVPVPPVKEQKKIAEILAQCDKVIELYQTKLEEIQNLKKGLLKKMFPQKGSNVPEVRFPGFIGPWIQHKVGEIGSVQTCKRVFKEQTSQTGEIPFYKNGTLGIQPDAYISRELFEDYKKRYPYPEIGDVMMSVVGSIGRTAEHLDVDEYFQDSNVVWLKTDSNVIDKKFLKASYQIIDWIIEGSTVKHLYNDNILLSKIWLTSISEQKKIGGFFEKFDNLISMYQNELLEMQTFQRGLKQLLLTGIVRIKV